MKPTHQYEITMDSYPRIMDLLHIDTHEIRATLLMTYAESKEKNARLRELDEPYRWVVAIGEHE